MLSRSGNFSVLRYEPVLKIDTYQRKAWNSANEIELSTLKHDPVGENFPLKLPPQSHLVREWRSGEELLQCVTTTLEQIALWKILLMRAV
jgi:hypothetical protein